MWCHFCCFKNRHHHHCYDHGHRSICLGWRLSIAHHLPSPTHQVWWRGRWRKKNAARDRESHFWCLKWLSQSLYGARMGIGQGSSSCGRSKSDFWGFKRDRRWYWHVLIVMRRQCFELIVFFLLSPIIRWLWDSWCRWWKSNVANVLLLMQWRWWLDANVVIVGVGGVRSNTVTKSSPTHHFDSILLSVEDPNLHQHRSHHRNNSYIWQI